MPSGALSTPIGLVTVLADRAVLRAIRIGAPDDRVATEPQPDDASSALLVEALAQLAAWFAGRSTRFDLPLAPAVTDAARRLRAAIVAVPAGVTAHYGDVARAAGSSARAAGQACARNPFPLVVPCHRVVGATGIGHYSAAGGSATKRWLLAHEGRNPFDG